ncbi:Bardet-Biedl syndrome 1 protein homolog isoform X2 [Anopheles albimanus]|uniref:Bardet-Biedl syndrome 1 protein homolog isoform X2 n=1 Tax=Anopheles albimanus TaxID=7167 RepID=UPI00164131D5|nr:Bardet-Biedl syndrome 1 protein homolog isoform X2 [Anopheles albimanus]
MTAKQSCASWSLNSTPPSANATGCWPAGMQYGGQQAAMATNYWQQQNKRQNKTTTRRIASRTVLSVARAGQIPPGGPNRSGFEVNSIGFGTKRLDHHHHHHRCGPPGMFLCKPKPTDKWLDAQCDGTAALHTLPSCMTLCDLKNDSYYQLIVVDVPLLDFDAKPKLKVYKGTNLVSEQHLPGIPCAVESLYISDQEPRIPIIAVAVESSVLFYRNLKPYYKYTLPSLTVEPLELDVWGRMANERGDALDALIESLRTIEPSQMTLQTQELLSLPDAERGGYIQACAERKLERLSIITAMATIRKASSEPKAASCLILATECGELLVLDTQAFGVLAQAKCGPFRGTPTLLSASGQYDVDYRVVIATREGSLCLLRKGWLAGQHIVRLEAPAAGLALLPIDQTIVVVCMNRTLVCYSKKGKKLWTVRLPQPAVCLTPVCLPHLGINLVCVGLKGGLVQFYSQRKLVDQFYAPESVASLTFGRLGQEEHVLVLVTVDGSLIVKILKRTAEFVTTENIYGDAPGLGDGTAEGSEDSAPPGQLQIPKKTKIFVEQTLREKSHAATIHGSFQSELWRMRLTTARATIDVINSADSNMSTVDVGLAPLKLAAEVLGLGPVFKLFLVLENISSRKEATGLSLLIQADHRHYCVDRPYLSLPMLVPGAPVRLDFRVTVSVDPADGLPPVDLTPENSYLKVLIFKVGQTKPLIASTVVMPQPEPQILNSF